MKKTIIAAFLACASPLSASAFNLADFGSLPIVPGNGPTIVRWSYTPGNEPLGISSQITSQYIERLLGRWEEVCNVKFKRMPDDARWVPGYNKEFDSDSSKSRMKLAEQLGSAESLPIVVIGFVPNTANIWNPYKVNGVSQASGVTSYVEGVVGSGRVRMRDIAINSDPQMVLPNGDVRQFEANVLHEMGHVLGLGHTVKPITELQPVMSRIADQTLRYDDIEGCASLYGYNPNAEIYRVFNNYEGMARYEVIDRASNTNQYARDRAPLRIPVHSLAGLFRAKIKSFGVSGKSGDFIYRYYEDTNFYVGYNTADKSFYYKSDAAAPVLIGSFSSEFTNMLYAYY